MDFQTPPVICRHMASMVIGKPGLVLEPTLGAGNLVRALESFGFEVEAPGDFFQMERRWYPAVVMNPPHTPMKLGYQILEECMGMSGQVIALMPWLALINSEGRSKRYREYGLRSVTHLPRSVFPGARIQTCILHLEFEFGGVTEFRFL